MVLARSGGGCWLSSRIAAGSNLQLRWTTRELGSKSDSGAQSSPLLYRQGGFTKPESRARQFSGRELERVFRHLAPRGGSCPAGSAAGPRRPTGARLLHLHLQLQRNLVDGAAASGFFSRNHKPHALAIAAVSTVGAGLWYMKKNVEHYDKSLRPSKIDWVEGGVVSPVVRKQNRCDCCWAIAVVASVDALHYIRTKQSITLSVQELIDCDTKNGGCKPGFCDLAFNYIKKNGLSTESSYPYTDQTSISGCKRSKTAARISGFRTVRRTEDALEKAVAEQPVVVSLQVSPDLLRYKGGIREYEALPETLYGDSKINWHSVLIVGYGTDPNGVEYWRFKNSWGEGWGEKGFGRIRRHVDDERGALGMFMWPAKYTVLNI